MTNRENMFSLIRRKGYETVPISYSLCPHLEENYSKRLHDLMEKNGLINKYSNKGAGSEVKFKTYPPETYIKYYNVKLKEGTTIDMFGVAHEPGSEAAMHMTHMRHPLEEMDTIEELSAYPYPEIIEDEEYLQECLEINKKCKEHDHFIMGNMQGTIWERAWYLRSMERLMMDMICDEELAEYVLDMITNIAIKQAEFFAKTGCDALFFGDDIGMQRTVMMSDELYTTWLKPRLKKVVDCARAINPDIIIFYHTCGFVEPFINHLIDAGVDVLNPVQPECMDFAEIHAKYGDRISFHGTIGTQTTMPFGTPEEVRETVFRNLDIAGEKGGLLPCPTHLLEPEVPVENIEAYILACVEYAEKKKKKN